MAIIYGRNPVIEALQQGKALEKVYLLHGVHGGKVNQIVRLCRQMRIPISTVSEDKIRQIAGNVAHQGVAALVAEVPIGTEEELLKQIELAEEQTCLVLLDRIQDPHNLGAIIRSAEVLGAHAVVFTTRETAPLTSTVIKASAGAIFHLPVYRVDNLVTLCRQLKELGFWIYGTAPEAGENIWEMDFNRRVAIIIGGEQKGIRPGLQKVCDVLFKIPQVGQTQSLNASVATGIILAEVLRQRVASNPASNE